MPSESKGNTLPFLSSALPILLLFFFLAIPNNKWKILPAIRTGQRNHSPQSIHALGIFIFHVNREENLPIIYTNGGYLGFLVNHKSPIM